MASCEYKFTIMTVLSFVLLSSYDVSDMQPQQWELSIHAKLQTAWGSAGLYYYLHATIAAKGLAIQAAGFVFFRSVKGN